MDKSEKILEKLEEHDHKFDSLTEIVMETRDQQIIMTEKMDRVIDTLDHVLHTVNRLDEERYAGIARIDRMQDEIDDNKKEIKKVKKVLKIA